MSPREAHESRGNRRLLRSIAAALVLLAACGTDSARAPGEVLDANELCDGGEEGCCGGIYCQATEVCVQDQCFTINCEKNDDCPEGALCSLDSHLCVPGIEEPADAGLDGGRKDAGHLDAGHVDGGHLDAGHPDAGHPDAGRPDAGHPDAGIDAGHPDAGHPDAGVDAGHPDAGHPDAGVDAGHPDAGVDAGHPDAGHPDAGVDGGHPDAGVRDGGTVCNGTCGTCGNGTVCNTSTCQCVNPNSTCSTSSNCLSGYVCVPISQIGMSYCLQVCGAGSACPGNQPCCSIPGQTVGVCSPIGVCQ